MVDFKRITDRAKDLVDKRGGTESLKKDAAELKDIARGPGSFKDKAKAAVEAIKDPGEDAPSAREGGTAASVAEAASGGERARAGRKVEGEGRGKHRHAGQGAGDGDPAV